MSTAAPVSFPSRSLVNAVLAWLSGNDSVVTLIGTLAPAPGILRHLDG